jgi:hypothetical protein
MRALYAMSDGLSLLHGNLNIHPLRAHKTALGLIGSSGVTLSEELREWEWRIPGELVIFGDNGGDESFGLWLPTSRSPADPVPVIEIAEGGEAAVEVEERDGFAVVGTDLPKFLAGWSAYYLLLLEADTAALEALRVPERFWNREADDLLMSDLLAWADPQLPDRDPHPYQRPVVAQALREMFGSDD